MYFLFLSKNCLTCHIASQILKEKGGTGSVQEVYVEFNKEKRIFETFIDGVNKGKAPVADVPALYSLSENKTWFGEDAIERIIDACWKD